MVCLSEHLPHPKDRNTNILILNNRRTSYIWILSTHNDHDLNIITHPETWSADVLVLNSWRTREGEHGVVCEAAHGWWREMYLKSIKNSMIIMIITISWSNQQSIIIFPPPAVIRRAAATKEKATSRIVLLRKIFNCDDWSFNLHLHGLWICLHGENINE